MKIIFQLSNVILLYIYVHLFTCIMYTCNLQFWRYDFLKLTCHWCQRYPMYILKRLSDDKPCYFYWWKRLAWTTSTRFCLLDAIRLHSVIGIHVLLQSRNWSKGKNFIINLYLINLTLEIGINECSLHHLLLKRKLNLYYLQATDICLTAKCAKISLTSF